MCCLISPRSALHVLLNQPAERIACAAASARLSHFKSRESGNAFPLQFIDCEFRGQTRIYSALHVLLRQPYTACAAGR